MQHRTTFLDRTFDFWSELWDACASLGFDPPSGGVAADLEALEAALSDRQFRVFVQGDVGPNNAVLAGGRARLVDFEAPGSDTSLSTRPPCGSRSPRTATGP